MSDDDQTKLQRRQILTDRYNSFLTATAFLVAAYVAVIAYHIRGLPHAINWVGLYLAMYFTIGNYREARLIADKKIPAPSKFVRSFLFEDIFSFICDPGSDFLCFELDTDKPNKILPRFVQGSKKPRTGYVHTWLIPIVFVVFWIFTWFYVLDDKWVPSLGIGLAFLYALLQILVPLLSKILTNVFKGIKD